jgi:hypothetical protein
METNKRRLGRRLFCHALGAALCAVFVIKTAGYIREIREGRESIARCREKLHGYALPPGYLSRLEEQLAAALETPEGRTQDAAQIKAEDTAGMIRDALRSHAVGVERLRTLSTGGAAATEFVLASPPANFLKFLQGAAELPLPLSYISIKPNVHSSAIDVTVRFTHAQ